VALLVGRVVSDCGKLCAFLWVFLGFECCVLVGSGKGEFG